MLWFGRERRKCPIGPVGLRRRGIFTSLGALAHLWEFLLTIRSTKRAFAIRMLPLVVGMAPAIPGLRHADPLGRRECRSRGEHSRCSADRTVFGRLEHRQSCRGTVLRRRHERWRGQHSGCAAGGAVLGRLVHRLARECSPQPANCRLNRAGIERDDD